MTIESYIGAYFLANDTVYEWAIPFLESFREFNPSLKLFLIPFDNNCNKIKKLSSVFAFDFYEDSTFAELEHLGQQLELGHTPTGPQWFRRFATFWGPLDNFIYLDTRVVVLHNLTPLIEALAHFHCQFLHFEGGLDQTYNSGYIREQLLVERRIQGFNSGKWITQTGIFDLKHLKEVGEVTIKNRHQFNPRNTDQFFLNYLIHSSDIKYASVHDLIPHLSRLTWPPMAGQIYQDEVGFKVWAYGLPEHKKQVVCLHWAGISNTPSMPRRNIYLKYRLKSVHWLKRWTLQIADRVKRPLYLGLNWLRANRFLNQFYNTHLKAR